MSPLLILALGAAWLLGLIVVLGICAAAAAGDAALERELDAGEGS